MDKDDDMCVYVIMRRSLQLYPDGSASALDLEIARCLVGFLNLLQVFVRGGGKDSFRPRGKTNAFAAVHAAHLQYVVPLSL